MPVSDAELVQRARDLTPGIRARAGETEKLRKPHDDSIRELIDAEIVQMLVPKRWGGSEASLSAYFDVVEAISAACPSTGWIAAFYIVHNTYVTKYPEQAQEELFDKTGYVLMPAASAPNMTARKVDGGWEVSGRAVWGSGVMHADWVMISGLAEDDQRGFLMPADDVEVKDVWHFTGMSGTGSNDYVVENVFVPDHRTVLMEELFEGKSEHAKIHDNLLYTLPFFISAYCTILPVLTGSLAGALEAYEEIADRRVRNFSGAVVKEQQYAHLTLGEFKIATLAARQLALSVFNRTTDILGRRDFTLDDRLEAKGMTAYVSKHCRDTANQMMAVAGASNFHADKPLQRIWRDLNTVCSHAFWDWDVSRELVGRRHFGLPMNFPLV